MTAPTRHWVDGAFVDGPAPADGDDGGLLETMGVFAGGLPLWPRHRARLQHGLRRLGAPLAAAAVDAVLPQVALDLLAHAPGDDIVRVCYRLRPRGHSLVVSTRRAADGPWGRDPVRLLPTAVPRPLAAPPADLKALPRAFQAAVLQQARAGGADDGVVLGTDGALLETAMGSLWLLLDGVWTTPPLDGRILPGIARAVLLEQARACDVLVAERPLGLGDLHRAVAIRVSNAAQGPRSAVLMGQTVAEADTALQRLWRIALGAQGQH